MGGTACFRGLVPAFTSPQVPPPARRPSPAPGRPAVGAAARRRRPHRRMTSRKQRVDPAGCETGIESIVAAIDCVDESVAGRILPQSGERERTTKGDDCGDSGDDGGDGGEDDEDAQKVNGKATTFLTDGWREVGSSGLTAAELATLTEGLPPAEHTLASLGTAESQGAQLQVLQCAWSAPCRPIPDSSIVGILGKLNKVRLPLALTLTLTLTPTLTLALALTLALTRTRTLSLA